MASSDMVTPFLALKIFPRKEVHHIRRRHAAADRLRWPGNVRELENAIETLRRTWSGPIVCVGDLPSSLQIPPPKGRRKKMKFCRWRNWSARDLRTLRERGATSYHRAHARQSQDHAVPQAEAVPHGARRAIKDADRSKFLPARLNDLFHFGHLQASSSGCERVSAKRTRTALSTQTSVWNN